MLRHATIDWAGDLPSGKGRLSTESGGVQALAFTAGDRFDSGEKRGTNPEELLAAAHGACFSMALTNELGAIGIVPASISTNASVRLDQDAEGFAITAVHLNVKARVAKGQERAARWAAKVAKDTCPISRLVRANLTMDFTVEP